MAIQVKFFQGMLGDKHMQPFQDEINGWLKGQGEGLSLHRVEMTSMGTENLHLGISIWYEVSPGGRGSATMVAGGDRESAKFSRP